MNFTFWGASAAILNSLLLLIRHSRARKPHAVSVYLSDPKQDFVCKLRKSGLQVATVSGNYVNEPKPGFRQISQPVDLEFVQLDQDMDSLTGLMAETIREILEAEGWDED